MEKMCDNRKKIIINITGSHLGFPIEPEIWENDIVNIDHLEEFLESNTIVLLCASLFNDNNDKKRIRFFKDIRNSPSTERTVIFSKNRRVVLRDDNLFNSLSIITLQGSAASALYHTLSNIYTPLINKNVRNSASIERRIASLQADLRANLANIEETDANEEGNDNNSLNIILSLELEVEYWKYLSQQSKNKEEQKTAAAFREILAPLARDFSVFDALPISEVEDLQENSRQVLDDLWRHEPPFPKSRMENLMEIISNEITIYIMKQFGSVNVWEQNIKTTELLAQCIEIGQHWLAACKELTEIFWPNYSLHTWKSEPFVPANLHDVVERLKEVQNIKMTHRQLTRLLTNEEYNDLNCDEMFKPLLELSDFLQCGTYSHHRWISAKKQFEYLLKPAERTVAAKLKQQFSSVNSNTRQLLYEFGRYSELIRRPILKDVLLGERKFLLNVLQDYLQSLKGQMSQTPILSTKYDTPQVVAEILGTRQLEAKVEEILNISKKILDDLEGFKDLESKSNDFLKDLKDQHSELFESWSSEITEQIKNHSLSLSEEDPVVQFTDDKMMRVNYSPRLVTLISEVRQLSTMGYAIPQEIIQTSGHAKQFMNYAKYLEQIAHFHNTIGDVMIPCQRPMMLASALELSRLVQEQEVVSWGNFKSVAQYVENLKNAVDKLGRENDLLASYHWQLMETINKLAGVDLIKHYDKWKQAAKDARNVMIEVQQKGFNGNSMAQWKQEIDASLGQVLQKQYSAGLHRVHNYLPEIAADLIYRDSKLCFAPDEAVLRDKYNMQLREFLDIPRKFRGVSDKPAFEVVIENSQSQLSKVTENTEGIFEQLQGVKKHWASWLTLDALDASSLRKWQDWELHFRSSKTFGQEIAKLPSTEEKVGCFRIGLSLLRSDLESHNRSYWDQLINTLKDSIVQDVVKLQLYVDTSTATLNRQPLTIEQIGEADASHADILTQRPEMEAAHKELQQKVNVLAGWTRERIDAVNRLETAWERLQDLMENYQHIIAKQVETVKTTLTIETENLNNEIDRFAARWEQIKPRPNSGQISTESMEELNKHLVDIKEKKEQWLELKERQTKLSNDFAKFNLEIPSFESGLQIEEDLTKEEETWTLFDEFYTGLENLGNEEWIVFRKKYFKFEDFLSEWETKLNNIENTPLTTRILQEIQKYQIITPVLKSLKGEDFTEKHWAEVYEVLAMNHKNLDDLLLKDFLKVSNHLEEQKEKLRAIGKRAASEIVVRQTLSELDQWDVQARFQFTKQNDSAGKEISLIKDFKEILNKIGDNQSLLQSVKNSADYESFSERASLWENRLSDLDSFITSLAQIQRKWVYLEPIFGSGTLANERNRFEKLDRDFRHLMGFIVKDSRVCALLRYPNLRPTIENLSEQLTRCQKGLDEFLAEKRNKFPRFLFLGDDDLLEVVGQSSKEQVIQTHLKKLFAGVHSIVLDETTGKSIIAIKSLETETVLLANPVRIDCPVEEWLNALVSEMQKTLQKLLIRCLADGKSPDPLKYPSQILCLAASINFTLKCEQAIASKTLSQLLTTYKSQLKYYSNIDLENEDLNSLGTEEQTNLLNIKLKALLLDTIHYIGIIEELMEANVNKITEWCWQKQLRFYAIAASGEVSVKMVNASLNYSFEYIGNGQKLVRTPLTEKCFLTLTQAIYLGMGGNPYGPAGTGKTESVKALGSLLGRQVLVFNCDKGIDSAAMERILSGLVKSGAWGCFDEFNRLDEATLSAISMHIQPIQSALRNNSKTVKLLDQEIQMNPHCGIFVTLNPAGGGYGGRNKLPDNLKQLFRPVVMTQPDHEQIARTLLHCDGYQFADFIGRKLVELFSLASNLLSKQQHYDWGLRALRTVLNGCARALKESKNSASENRQLFEYQLVIRSIKVDTMSKLTLGDGQLFDDLINCVFPDLSAMSALKTSDDEILLKALEESFNDLKLTPNNRQTAKCIELYEQLKQRMGVALVGPPQSGKSTIRNLLATALSKMGKQMRQYVFNPKSMQRTQLLGQIDLETRQWSDGVLTLYSLQVANEPLDVWSLIVCDGDVDPEWVESLNSVMDDNRLLSLPSGWRIQFGPNVNFIFETHELTYASPATISRMGIVFLNEDDVQLDDYVANCLQNFPLGEESSLLSTFMDDFCYKAVDWILNEGELIIQRPKVSLVNNILSLVENAKSKQEFLVELLNGFGGQLDQDFRELFAQFIFELSGEHQPPLPACAKFDYDRQSIDSYQTEKTENCTLEGDNNDNISLISVAQVQQTLHVVKKWLLNEKPKHFALIGPHGSAKTLIIENTVRERPDSTLVTVHCSTNLTPQYVIQKLSQYCMAVNSGKGKVFKAKRGHITLHLKNMHLLKNDKWGTNMLEAFLQQLIVYGGFFDNSLEWISIENVTVVATMLSRNNLSARFTSLLNVYTVDLPTDEDLTLITGNYLTAILKKCAVNTNIWSKNKITKLTITMISIYNEVKEKFTEIQSRHYVFSPHDLINWCRGILRYKLQSSDVESTLLEIICNESMRIFCDRLIDSDHKEQFQQIVNAAMQRDWSKSNILGFHSDNYYVAASQFNKYPVALTKLNSEDWNTIIKKGIVQYEREGFSLDLIIIPELLQLTAALSRALTIPENHCLLIGKAGVGRKSAVKIISALESAKIVIPASSENNFFKNDLKMAMQFAAIEGTQVILLLEDHILSNENMLNAMNIFLSSGEVPGLYNATELESLTVALKDEATHADFEGNLYDFFLKRVRSNIHVTVCLDVLNSNFWNVLECCPALSQKCTQIWLSEWSEKTMDNMPEMFIDRYNGKLSKNKEKALPPLEFSKILEPLRDNLKTPLRFMTAIKTYVEIYNEKQNSITSKQQKLKAGVDKLTEAKNVVAQLKQEASEQQEKLAEKQKKANKALDMISNTMKNANVQKEEMEKLKLQTEEENQQLVKRKKQIEIELAEVEPLIQEARKSVGTIKSESLSEIRSLRAPPEVIRDILEGVLRLMGIQDTSWNSMKTFLAKRGVKEDIRAFDVNRITPESRQAVEKLMATKPDSFEEKTAKRASVAAAPLATWVLANVKYSKVAMKIKPLETEQRKLRENLQEAEAQLEALSSGLMDVDSTVEKLKKELSTFTREGAEIEIKLKAAQETLASAEGLVDKLIDEYDRWKIQLKELETELGKLPSSCLLSAVFISYLSEEFEDLRRNILNKWLEIKEDISDSFSLESFLSSERQQVQWQSEGLSSDYLSIQNAIIINSGLMCPFLIDPTSMAVNWIKNKMNNKNFECTTQDSSRFNTQLELAVRFGKVFLIEEVESISPLILTLLKRQFIYQGERILINLNGKLLDYSRDFQLLLSTRNANLRLPGEISALLNTINFTTTKAGLGEQLLLNAIRQESPELEKQRKTLLRQREELQEKQYNLQSQLLEDLANSTGNILENKNLLDSLNETKASSVAIKEALDESLKVQGKLNEEYKVYEEIAKFASDLYFAVGEFSKSNILYSLSVDSFTKLFLKSLALMESHTDNYRLKILMQILYQYVGRGMFKSDRPKFLLHLIHKLFPTLIPEEEWNFLIGNNLVSNRPETSSNQLPSWIPNQFLSQVNNLKITLPSLYDSLNLENTESWKDFMQNPKCETSFPSHCKLTEFQKIIVVQILRSDRLYSAILLSIMHLTGINNLNLDIVHLSQIYKESSNGQPILILTTSGNDPSQEIRDLASKEIAADKYIEMSMGEGQESNALESLKHCAQSGNWLILKNLHLVTEWIPILNQNLQSLNPADSFRLWLVTEANANFSSVLAENSLKFVYEAPQGLRNNLYKIFSSYGMNFIQSLNPTSCRIFFILSWLHSIFQDRRNFIPQGWSKWYEFNDIDLSTMVKLSKDIWNASSTVQVPWKFLVGWASDAVYGGRVEEQQDLRILGTFLNQFLINESLSHRWKPLSTNQSIPSSASYQDYLNFISSIQNDDSPSDIGLPSNIHRAWERQTSQDIIQFVKNLTLSKNVSSPGNYYKNLNPYVSLWKKLNQGFDFVRASVPTTEKSNYTLETFIIDEYKFALQLIQHIHKAFGNLNKMSKGHSINSEKYQKIAADILNLTTPNHWQNLWAGPKEPALYLKEVIRKTIQITEWHKKSSSFYKEPINFGLLFNPKAFLAAFKKQYAAYRKLPLDELSLRTDWRMKDGAIIASGLKIEGASFDGSELVTAKSTSESITEFPDVFLSWEETSKNDANDRFLELPLYFTSRREDLLTRLQVPCITKDKPLHIMSAVALFLNY